MIAVQIEVPIEEATARPRAYSWDEDLELGEVARDVVGRRLRFDDGDGATSRIGAST
jgi:hypothetical protein